MKRQIVFLYLVIFLLWAKESWAHFLWINPQAYHLIGGEELRFTLGFGHHFPGPGGDFLEQSFLKSLTLYTPAGKSLKVKEGKYPILFKTSALFEEGTYLLAAERKPGFFSKTAYGFARKPKNALKDVIECKFSKRYAKALITVGKPKGKLYRQVLGHELEIILLKDPGLLKIGDTLPFKVFYQGRPYARAMVLATYEGFSPREKAFYSFAVRTNAQGEGVLRLDHHGPWLIVVAKKKPYPEANVCDVETLVATFTFELP